MNVNDIIKQLEKAKNMSSNSNMNKNMNMNSNMNRNMNRNINKNNNGINLNIDLSKMKENVRKERQEKERQEKERQERQEKQESQERQEKKESSYNFDKFDISELLLLFKIDEREEDLNLEKIQHYTNEFINKIPESHGNIRDMLIPSKDKLLNFFIEKNKINSNTVETNNNISLSTVDKDNTFDQGTGVIIPRTQLDNNTAYDAPIKEGKLNPKLENIIQRTLVIDSRYRQFNYYPLNESSDVNAAAALLNPIINTNPFTIDLEHPISDLLSFKLFSLHIPLVWNNITSTRRNNFFLFPS